MIPNIHSLQEIYLSEDDRFFVGVPLLSICDWDVYLTFDEVGEDQSIYFFNTNKISKLVKESAYLEFLKFGIQQTPNTFSSTLDELQRHSLKNKPTENKPIESILAENQIVGVGEAETGDRYLGKICSLHTQGITLEEFDFNTCKLVEESLFFSFSEIEHLEFSSKRTKLVHDYLGLN